MAAPVDNNASRVIDRFRYDLEMYKLQVEDPIMETLRQEGLLTVWDMEVINEGPTPADRMRSLIHNMSHRVTTKNFQVLLRVVREDMGMPAVREAMMRAYDELNTCVIDMKCA